MKKLILIVLTTLISFSASAWFDWLKSDEEKAQEIWEARNNAVAELLLKNPDVMSEVRALVKGEYYGTPIKFKSLQVYAGKATYSAAFIYVDGSPKDYSEGAEYRLGRPDCHISVNGKILNDSSITVDRVDIFNCEHQNPYPNY